MRARKAKLSLGLLGVLLMGAAGAIEVKQP